MKKRAIDALDPELRQLLDAEADFPPENELMAARVWKSVQTAIVAVPPGGSTSTAPEAPASASALAKYITVAALAFLAGGLSGAAIYHGLARPEPSRQEPAAADATPVAHVAPPPQIAPVPSPIAVPITPTPPPQPSTAPAAQPTASTKGAVVTASDLARERAIIEVARTAVSRGRISAALDAIERHAREFPKGQLAEEREGLRVIALARGGRSEEAEQRASAFRKRYPKSVLLPATEAAVESEPKP
jgi:hypothetical protein